MQLTLADYRARQARSRTRYWCGDARVKAAAQIANGVDDLISRLRRIGVGEHMLKRVAAYVYVESPF